MRRLRAAAASLAGLGLMLTAPDVVAAAEGPYVTVATKGWLSRVVGVNGEVHESAVRHGRISVPAVGAIPGFEVVLRAPPSAAPSMEALPRRTPLLVLADTHGEYPILVAMLKAQGIIDDQLRWAFGGGHLVVDGDMLDRGAHQIEILWLLYKLEADAQAAGGRVHVLIGNHEALVLRGDERYLNPRYRDVARRLGVSHYARMLDDDSVLGAWLRSRPAMLKLGDLLLVHGGVSPQLTQSDLGLDEINAIVRRYLDVPHTVKPTQESSDALIVGADGPLWYRGYFPTRDAPPAATDAEVAASLSRFGASRILVGHTVVDSVRPLYGGKVIAVQVYPHIDEVTGSPILEGALRLDGKWYRATAQGDRTSLGVADGMSGLEP